MWRETLSLTASQLADGATISGYGANCATTPPRITGSNDFSTGWTLGADGVWSRPVPAGTPKITRLFVNGGAMRTAQWPNYGGIGSEYAIASPSSPVSQTQLVVAAADLPTLAGQDLVGAVLRVRDAAWRIDDSPVSAFDPSTGRLTVSTPTSYNMMALDGYVPHRQAVDARRAGRVRATTTAANMLYVHPADAASQADLNSALVEGTVRDNGMLLGTTTRSS